MRSLPKPLIGLLLGTVAFFAVWMVALKPSSSSSGGSPNGVGQYQSAINQAHQAVTTSNQANAKLGAPTATTTAPAAKPATTTKTSAKAAPAAKASARSGAASASASASAAASAAAGVQTVENAVRAGKVVAVLFYNGAAADDKAMKTELAAIPTHKGQVVKLAVPVSQLTQFSLITTQVPVDTSPTLVLIDRARQATSLIGYADGVEIAQRIDDALAATPAAAKPATK
jgi:hypothetical protein